MGTVEAHISHITATLEIIAENQHRLDEALVTLVDAQIQTQQRFAEVAERFAETDRRFADTDERIARLVSAIGELVRQTPRKPGS